MGEGQKDTLQSGFTGNHILMSQASVTLAEALPVIHAYWSLEVVKVLHV